jgi:hypothetical protein
MEITVAVAFLDSDTEISLENVLKKECYELLKPYIPQKQTV